MRRLRLRSRPLDPPSAGWRTIHRPLHRGTNVTSNPSDPEHSLSPNPLVSAPERPPGAASATAGSQCPKATDQRLRQLLSLISGSNQGGGPVSCPRCSGRHLHRWGTVQGRQRYRCLGCRRTFTRLSGTPSSGCRNPGTWGPYLLCFARGESLRVASRHCGIALSTAFRRRHRILQWLQVQETRSSSGQVGSGSFRWISFPESFKGARRLPRPPRTHAIPWGRRHIAGRRAWVLGYAMEVCPGALSQFRLVMGPVQDRPPTIKDLRPPPGPLLGTVVDRRGLLRHRPREGKLGQDHGRQPPRDLRGEQAELGSICLGFRRWLSRFRGVATRYLAGYAAWFQRLVRLGEKSVVGAGQVGSPGARTRENHEETLLGLAILVDLVVG